MDLENDSLELIALEINKPNSKPFLVLCWYRPPLSPVEHFDVFESLLKQAELGFSDIYITGDINCNLLKDPRDCYTTRLINIIEAYQLTQVISEPTRITSNTSTLIDLFITNNRESIVHSGVYSLSISDHNLIFAIRKIGIPRRSPRYVETRNFKKFNANAFLSDLKDSHLPQFDANSVNVNEAWLIWKDNFLNVLNKHAPKRVIKVRNKPAPWLNSEIKKEMFNRDSLKKKAIKSGSQDDWSTFKKARNAVNYSIRCAKSEYYHYKLNENAGDQKATWKVLNDLMGKKSAATEVNEILTSTNTTLKNAGHIANHLNVHFTEIGPRLATNLPVSSTNAEDYLKREPSSFEFAEIEPSRTLKLLSKLDITKATGLDQISNKVLKLAAPVIYKQLTELFNLSLKSGEYPDDWKLAKVSPVFKAGERNDPNNYRPISILSTISRVFEKLVYEQIYNYLIKTNLLDSRQSGFRSLHSTVTALLDLTNQWCFNIDRGLVSGILFLDLKKAFDTVDHQLLLTKLEYIGIRGHALEWFKSYLESRFQIVFTNGVLSDKAILRCGVPQGSILGPLLFLIYINDLTAIADYATVRMYADDTNMTFTACGIPELQHDMNIDLQFLQNWLIANRLTLNVLKREFMLVGSRQRVATLTQELDLSINGISLKRVNSSKCLGVEIDEFLTWDAHISSVSKKVSSGIGVIKKIKPFVPSSNLISVYQSIVEPYLDYCSVVWDDISDQLTDKLQILQNRAARVITGADYRTPSSDLLNKLGWSSLKEKRNKQKALIMFKIMNGMTPAYLEDIFTRNIGRSVYII